MNDDHYNNYQSNLFQQPMPLISSQQLPFKPGQSFANRRCSLTVFLSIYSTAVEKASIYWVLILSQVLFLKLFLLNFNFIGVQLIYSVVLVSGVRLSDSVIHIHIFILFYILFSYRLSQNVEQSSLCSTVGSLLVIYLIYSSVYMLEL